ncbi:unnamed protein product [Trifolium pratense]|uniref:Uncharacterized protein n=1 Tax=Trifolium pratense TaxID=57577 RepID=A0ACB0JMT3_TRIPR|nr:unnamed protein product [Trifolium pratense]
MLVLMKSLLARGFWRRLGLKDIRLVRPVFLRAGQMAELDTYRSEILGKSVTIIQRKIRSYLSRRSFVSIRLSAIQIQAASRGICQVSQNIILLVLLQTHEFFYMLSHDNLLGKYTRDCGKRLSSLIIQWIWQVYACILLGRHTMDCTAQLFLSKLERDKSKAFQEVCEKFRFLHPAEWFEKRPAYTRSVAASSMDKLSTLNLKIEALIFRRLVLSSHSPDVFHPYIKTLSGIRNSLLAVLIICKFLLFNAKCQLLEILSLGYEVISNVLETGPGWRLVSPHFTTLLESAIFPAFVMNVKMVVILKNEEVNIWGSSITV